MVKGKNAEKTPVGFKKKCPCGLKRTKKGHEGRIFWSYLEFVKKRFYFIM